MTYNPLQLAEAFIQTGELPDALDALDMHLAEQPHDDDARRLRIDVLLRLPERHADALADLDALQTATAADHVKRSLIHEQAGDRQAALAAMAAARSIQPDDARLVERTLHLLRDDGQRDAALALVREQPRTWQWLAWEGDLLAAQGDDTTATARYGLALAHLGTPQDDYMRAIAARLLLARAAAYHRLDLTGQAEQHYAQAQGLAPDDPVIPFNRGLLRALDGDPGAAQALCAAALASANDALQAEMRATLDGDPRYAALRERL